MRNLAAAITMAAAMLGGGALAAEPAAPDLDQIIAQNTTVLSYADGKLGGPGAEVLRKAMTDAQFVLMGEDHYDYEIPRFAGALYSDLHRLQGFHHLAVEQDSVSMEEAMRPGARGQAAQMGAVAARYPSLFEFASDQDLELLAQVGRTETNAQPLWGLEQATGAIRYLTELQTLATTAALKSQVAALLADARKAEPRPAFAPSTFMQPDMLGRLERLQTSFAAKPGSRAATLLEGLVKSAEIYSYYSRAEAGENVGLYNNTVRESWFKTVFMRDYHRAQAGGEALPKVMFKFGDGHMFRGMGPTTAYTIGNFAHEFAISNGKQAIGIQLFALRKDRTYADLDGWVKVFMPATAPTQPTLIDLRPMRLSGRLFRAKVKPEDQWLARNFVNGYDFILVIPDSRRATMALSGLKTPY